MELKEFEFEEYNAFGRRIRNPTQELFYLLWVKENLYSREYSLALKSLNPGSIEINSEVKNDVYLVKRALVEILVEAQLERKKRKFGIPRMPPGLSWCVRALTSRMSWSKSSRISTT
jgi:hypothetical protein